MRIILFSFILLTWVSCGMESSDQSKANAFAVDSSATDTLIYSYQEHTEVSPYVVNNDNGMDTAFYRIQYPQFTSSRWNDIVKSHVLFEGEETAEQAAQNFLSSYNEFVEDNSTMVVNAAWYKDLFCTVTLNTPLIVSLRNKYADYTGGAHGNHYLFFSNFDILKGEKITLNDIVDTDKQKEFTKIAERNFRITEEIDLHAPLDSPYFFDNGLFALNDNFGFERDHLVFYFNEYEIQPYSEGGTAVQIPYSEISQQLNIRGKQYIESIKKN